MADRTRNPSDAKVIKSEPLNPKEGKWARLVKITYQDPLGNTREWESAERTTRPATAALDGVGVIAILDKSTGPELLLQKQFRPPTNKVMIEIPAGLIDEGETPEECAIRELKEETGYVGTVIEGQGKPFLMFNDPGFTNTNTLLIHLHIDPSKSSNQPENLRPQLEENEFIETFSLPLKTLWADLAKMERDEGYAIDARVGTLAEGLEVARRFGGLI